ncbi:hypothetical protein MFIFM68171_02726 [Madurella fahalii]|uniref:F-box domain-containing protein n=1 Tax=Madurella fahalii TaxID=1157608 RepID=A0ABQ0G421_9PEZI
MPSPSRTHDGTRPRHCFIFRLPNEVLAEIIETVAAWPDNADQYMFQDLYADHWAMTLVCRRFHLLAMPVLYSTIILGDVIEPPFPELLNSAIYTSVLRKSMMLLHRSIKNNRSLGLMCRGLVFDLRASAVDVGSKLLDVAADLVTWFTYTKSLRIREVPGGCRSSAYATCLTAACANMPRLERLVLNGMPGDVMLTALRDRISSSIKELKLTGLSKSRSDGTTGWIRPRDATCKGRGPFTELWISDFQDWLDYFVELMSWPEKLERFTLLGMNRLGYHHLDLQSVWGCLVPHALSLESIRIGSIFNQHPYLHRVLTAVSFNPFERLTFLSLSYWATGSGEGEANLLAPRLQTFEWMFDAQDQRQLYLDDFQQQEEDFLRKLANGAITRKVPLRKILITKFAPEATTRRSIGMGVNSTLMGGLDAPLEYPWDRMGKVAGELLPSGIQLLYNEPIVTREEFRAGCV